MCSWCNPVTRKQTKQWIQKYPPEWHTIYPGQIWMQTIMEQCFFLTAAFNLIVFLGHFFAFLYFTFSLNCMYACVIKKINLIFQPEHWRQQAAHLWGSYFCKFIQNTVSSAFSVKSRTYQSKNDRRGGTGCDKLVTPFEYTHTYRLTREWAKFPVSSRNYKGVWIHFFSTFDISANHPMGQSVPGVWLSHACSCCFSLTVNIYNIYNWLK